VTADERSRLIAALLGPGRRELTCERCFELLDRYVDVELSGGDPDAAVPGMRAHLEGCPACLDDYRSLAAFVTSGEAGEPPEPAA
jgi:anti-sigma factor RsiW